MASTLGNVNQFHEALAQDFLKQYPGFWATKQDVEFTYRFDNFFHPFASELIEQLNRKSLPGLFDPKFQQGLTVSFFDKFYSALTSDVVKVNSFPKEVDLREGGPYANYNWELLFHVPLTIAVHLSKNQRFAEARHWFHYIFDPTSNDTAIPVPQRFWRFLAFRQVGRPKQIDEQLANLSKPSPETDSLLQGLDAIRNDPFQPHKIARTRQLAYQYYVVMKYLDNLIAWGDSLFQQDTIESINEATQLYVLASNLLGQRPQRVPQPGAVRPKTFAELKQQGLDPMGNALVSLEGQFPLDLGMPKTQGVDSDTAAPLFGIGRTLYFCIPRNERLLGYWDTVGDRLFKIRHCMNIEGVVRQLALYDPPLDPGMLVKAAAAGIDVGSILSGTNQPVSPVRPLLLIQKALELCAELRGLGAALLSAIEKGDGERLTALRQGHEIKIQKHQQDIRYLQWASAQEVTRSLLTSRKAALERLRYYQRLLDLPADQNAPDVLKLSFEGLELTEENFSEAYSKLVGQYDRLIATEPFPPLSLSEEGRARLHLTTSEDDEFEHLKRARDTGFAATVCNAMAAGFAPIPDAGAHFHFWGLGGSGNIKVGTALVAAAKVAGDVLGIISVWEREQAGLASKTAACERRADEWLLQHNLAAHELMQIGRQILASLITEQIAFHEYQTIKKSIEDAEEVDRFLHQKFSNEQLYAWMQGEMSRLYYEYYRFAYDTARKAERAMKQELMRPEVEETDFIKFNYWDGGRKGLLSGEALYLDVKRMELAYHEHNRRELELTKHVSLRQLDPIALLTLKATGTCQVTIPEWLYDLDCPGHYLRRIKSVALSIPSVVGPYTSLNCTLSLLKSRLRKSPLGDPYARQEGSEDARFVDYFSAAQTIVTSSAQNDSGLFETSLRDERLLPFEGAGAESTWRLDLPKDYRAFDYGTIQDVIFHIRFTARPGVNAGAVKVALDQQFQGLNQQWTFALLFSLRHDFPSEWSSFANSEEHFSATIGKRHFPYFATRKNIIIKGCDLYDADVSKHHIAGDQATWNTATDELGEIDKQKFTISLAPDGPGPNRVLTREEDAQAFLIIRYSLS
jgi:hypothetical protein